MADKPNSPPPPPATEAEDEGSDPSEAEALRLLSLAEARLRAASPAAALKYAKQAACLRPGLAGVPGLVTALKILRADPSDHYKVLRLPPLSTLAAVRRQYKALALALNPDKSSSASDAVTAAAEEAFKRVTESLRLLSDHSLKRALDDRLRRSSSAGGSADTFWTACGTCRLLHEFDRRYVGYRLVCPSCCKSFLAVEVPAPEDEANGYDSGEDKSKVGATKSWSSSRPRVSRSRPSTGDKRRNDARVSGLSPVSKKHRMKPERTLAEMQEELTRAKHNKHKMNENRKRIEEKEMGKEGPLVRVKQEEEDLGLMAVEDSDFYNFDKDRSEKSFWKGQVWAIYDDDDGMPRHYGLIEEVLSSNPFRVRMNWLDIQTNGDESLMALENTGLHISCGQFKVGRKIDIESVNLFSHLINCERAAREIYRIYPKKGSVWALYSEQNASKEEGRHCYDIVVFLTNHSEVYGLSMAYLEKVEGYKTIFKRQAIGAHAITWLEKGDVRLFSHQIPARKLSGEAGLGLPGGCWELDPASLPPELVCIASIR